MQPKLTAGAVHASHDPRDRAPSLSLLLRGRVQQQLDFGLRGRHVDHLWHESSLRLVSRCSEARTLRADHVFRWSWRIPYLIQIPLSLYIIIAIQFMVCSATGCCCWLRADAVLASPRRLVSSSPRVAQTRRAAFLRAFTATATSTTPSSSGRLRRQLPRSTPSARPRRRDGASSCVTPSSAAASPLVRETLSRRISLR